MTSRKTMKGRVEAIMKEVAEIIPETRGQSSFEGGVLMLVGLAISGKELAKINIEREAEATALRARVAELEKEVKKLQDRIAFSETGKREKYFEGQRDRAVAALKKIRRAYDDIIGDDYDLEDLVDKADND